MFRKRWWIVAATGAILVVIVAMFPGGGVPRQEQLRLLDPAQVLVLRTPGGMLELATMVKIEEFGWQSSYTCPPFDCGALGHTVSRIRVPVHYVYRVPLSENWQLRLEGDQYVLRLPAPVPQLPAAVDTRQAKVEVNGKWSTPSKIETMESMLRQLTPELNRRATQPEYLALQRAASEKTATEFAEKWMREQINTPTRPVRVVFKDANSG